ncbi:MAG TPA: hypothetical protein VML94_08300 [Thermoplasmata archaeon]|nr:hypothetical protein [Thermoplasmata archaeon]
MVRNQGRVTRFVVMAVLQAARAKTLGLPLDSAYSWGLNRAIFYAAAKRGFSGSAPSRDAPSSGGPEHPVPERFRLGDEEAIRDPSSPELLFTIGGRDQTQQAFEEAVVARFGTPENFRTAWKEALAAIETHDRGALESQRRFYAEVYKPRRDELSDSWSERFSPPPKRSPRQRTE